MVITLAYGYKSVKWDILLHGFAALEGIGFIRTTCPFASLHTAKSTENDFCYNTTISPENGFMLIGASCWHSSCRSNINQMLSGRNKKWKKYVDEHSDKVIKVEKTTEQLKEELHQEHLRICEREKHDAWKRKIIFEITRWNKVPVPKVAPVFVDPAEDFAFHLGLFHEDDILFLGDFNEPWKLYKINDKDLERLQNIPEFTSSYTFKDVNAGRNANNCQDKPYGVLELDNGISKEEQLSLLLSISKTLNVKLLMALDSGGKSVHGWFYWKDVEKYAEIFEDLGYDMKTFKSRSQPVRLAGAFRQNKQKYQRVIYKG